MDGEDGLSSGLVQVSDGLHAKVLLWCTSGPIARRWIVLTCVWRLSDCKNASSCWEIATRGPVEGVLRGTSLSVDARRVFGEWLVVFNCSVLSFWNGNKLPSWIENPVRYNIINRITGSCDRMIKSPVSYSGGPWTKSRETGYPDLDFLVFFSLFTQMPGHYLLPDPFLPYFTIHHSLVISFVRRYVVFITEQAP
jgi:hypothetical protein